MKAAVGSMVIVVCVFGVAGWLLLVRWYSASAMTPSLTTPRR